MTIGTRLTDTRHLAFKAATLLACFLTLCVPVHANEQARRADDTGWSSLGPTITEKLYLLGMEDRLVGVTTYCVRPPEACTKEKVGNVTQVNVERIVELNQDVVFATSLTDRRSVESLKRLGIRVVVFNEPKSYGETSHAVSRSR